MDNAQAIERLSRLEAHIVQAAQACHSCEDAPQALDRVLSELETQSHRVRDIVQDGAGLQAQDPARLLECVDSLKSLGDQAARACDEAQGLDEELRRCVQDLQNEIAHLRRQLHGTENRREERSAIRDERGHGTLH